MAMWHTLTIAAVIAGASALSGRETSQFYTDFQPEADSDTAEFSENGMLGDTNADSDVALYADVAAAFLLDEEHESAHPPNSDTGFIQVSDAQTHEVFQPEADSDMAQFSKTGMLGDTNADSDAALYADVAAEQTHTFVNPRNGPDPESDSSMYASARHEQRGEADGEASSESDEALHGSNSFIQVSSTQTYGVSQPEADSDMAQFSKTGMLGDTDADSDAALYADVAAEQQHTFVNTGDVPDPESDDSLYVSARREQRGDIDGEASAESDAALFGGRSFLQVSSAKADRGSTSVTGTEHKEISPNTRKQSWLATLRGSLWGLTDRLLYR
jgi:hypothetical protein